MKIPYARFFGGSYINYRVFGCLTLLLSSINSSVFLGCKKHQPPEVSLSDGMSLMRSDAPSPLHFIDATCISHDEPDKPDLYAHYLNSSSTTDTGLEDFLIDHNATTDCAPGPFSANNKKISKSNQWKLEQEPDFFVWPLTSNTHKGELFYITNRSGMPLKSQTINIERAGSKAIILKLQTPLKKNSSYYIYQVIIDKGHRATWIQPIMAS